MPSASILDRDLKERLGAALAGSQARAGLTNLTLPCPDFDPVSVFERGAGKERFFWQQRSRDVTLVGLGATRRLQAHGPERFESMRRALRRLHAEVVATETDEPAPFALPLVLGGFAFGPDQAERDVALPDALFVVPRLLFIRQGGRSWLNLTLPADAANDAEAIAAEVARLLTPVAPALDETPCLTLEDANDRDSWERAVTGALAEIERGTVEKVVLARRVVVRANAPIDTACVLRRLSDRYESATVFAFDAGRGCFLGATPERLLRLDRSAVAVDCLAGSTGRGRDATEDEALATALFDDAKERNEHAIVLRAVRKSIAPLCVSLEATDLPRILKAATVQHLHTPVTGAAKPGRGVLDFVERLPPTPATGGYPREAALSAIGRYESFDRCWYAGPIGWADAASDGDFVVGIRSALIEGTEATLYAGCGIVAGSDPGREYEESKLKLGTMLWALQNE